MATASWKEAYDRGAYERAYGELRPLAEAGHAEATAEDHVITGLGSRQSCDARPYRLVIIGLLNRASRDHPSTWPMTP